MRKRCIKPQLFILLGIPILFVVGSLMHFAYEWSSNSILVGIFTPINESVWEHLKMAFFPMLAWWLLYYFLCGKRVGLDKAKWIFAAGLAVLIAPLTIMSFYYTYTGALGIHSLLLDIFSLLLGIGVGQIVGLHLYKYSNAGRVILYISIGIVFILTLCFALFTFNPPTLPLFMDSLTGAYGM